MSSRQRSGKRALDKGAHLSMSQTAQDNRPVPSLRSLSLDLATATGAISVMQQVSGHSHICREETIGEHVSVSGMRGLLRSKDLLSNAPCRRGQSTGPWTSSRFQRPGRFLVATAAAIGPSTCAGAERSSGTLPAFEERASEDAGSERVSNSRLPHLLSQRRKARHSAGAKPGWLTVHSPFVSLLGLESLVPVLCLEVLGGGLRDLLGDPHRPVPLGSCSLASPRTTDLEFCPADPIWS